MNDVVLNELTAHIAEAIESLPASGARRQKMREELLAHLLDIYDEELERVQDELAAIDLAKERFGRPDDLRSELTTAVPSVERLILLICGKGSIMWRWFWIVGVLGVFVGMGFVLPAVAQLRDPAPIMPSDRFGIGVLLPFGVVVTLLGLGFFAYSLHRVFRARRC
jgi:hypothetical protein